MWIYLTAPFVLLLIIIPFIVLSNKSSKQTEKAEASQKKKLTGKQRARRIALFLMILAIMSNINDIITKGAFGYSDMINIPFEIVMTYCLVMFVGYPIARRIAERKNSKDRHN